MEKEIIESPKRHKRIRLSPDVLAKLSQAGKGIKFGGIKLTPQALKDVDLLSRSQTASIRLPESEEPELCVALEKARGRLGQIGIDVNLITTYNLPPDVVKDLVGKLSHESIPYKKGPKGLEVYGPHRDRSVDINTMVASGRISLQKNSGSLISERIEIKKSY